MNDRKCPKCSARMVYEIAYDREICTGAHRCDFPIEGRIVHRWRIYWRGLKVPRKFTFMRWTQTGLVSRAWFLWPIGIVIRQSLSQVQQ